MIIGVPKEIKKQEYRIGLVPAGVKKLIDAGHKVLIEKGAGQGSGIADISYQKMGALILPNKEEIWAEADMIIKVKEPIEPEYQLMKKKQILYTYLHLAAVPELTKILLEKEISAIGYETIELDDGSLPLLRPMSEIAGKMAIQVGATYLEKEKGGKGILLGGVPGVRPAKVVIIGGGTVGTNAAKIAVGMGASVFILDNNISRLVYLDDIFSGRVVTLYSDIATIEEHTKDADLLVGGVLIAGARAPKLVSREMVKNMNPGSVIVDVSVDQGGCIETSRATDHEKPTYEEYGVVHYGVTNMPGAVPRTSTFALTNATIYYAEIIANMGIEKAISQHPPIKRGVNTYRGNVTHKAVAESLGYNYSPIKD